MSVQLDVTKLGSVDITKAISLYLETNGIKCKQIGLGINESGVYAELYGAEETDAPQSVIISLDKHLDAIVNEKVLQMLLTGRITVGQIEMVRYKLRNQALSELQVTYQDA